MCVRPFAGIPSPGIVPAVTPTAHTTALPLTALGLATPAAAGRLRADLNRAEQRFVADVVRMGGIGPWRRHLDSRFATARGTVVTGRLSRAETAGLVVALVDLPTRDRCWRRVEDDGPEDWLPLWRHLVRHALPPFRVEPLFLLAWSTWRLGHGSSAGAAVDVLLTEDPGHRAGGMLALLVRAGVPPSAVIPLVVDPPAVPAERT
jgi:hypothetical protein